MNFYHKLLMYRVTLSCGCVVSHRVAPPVEGDTITCIRHGAVDVLSREQVKQSGDASDNSRSSGCTSVAN